MKRMLALWMVVLIPFSSGCATIRVMSRPAKKDMSILQPGMSRGKVIAELGNPDYTLKEKGKKVDLYHFRKGLTKWAKFCRSIFHLSMDFFTVGFWEIVASPTESVLANKKVRLRVVYDKNERVESYTDWGKVEISTAPARIEYIKPE